MNNERPTGSPVRARVTAGSGTAALFLAALALMSCGADGRTGAQSDGTPSDSPRCGGGGRICEGTGIRFAWQSMPAGNPTMGEKLTYQNGLHGLFVNGDCQYWVYGARPEGMPRGVTGVFPARAGRLTAQQEERLASDMGYSDWTSRAEVDSYADGTAEYLWRPGCKMTKTGNLFAKPLGETQLKTWIQTAASWLGQLYEAGTDMDGPLRVRAVAASDGRTNPRALESPLLDVSDMAVTWDDEGYLRMSDPATLVTDADVVGLLREQREPIANGEFSHPDNPERSVLPVNVEGQLYYVYFRDVIPLEDDNGLIRPY